MNMEKKIISHKKYTIEVISYEDGTTTMNRTNDGFSIVELLGITTMVQQHMLKVMEEHKNPNPDKINIQSKNSPLCH